MYIRAFDILAALMKKFAPKNKAELGAVLFKFGQLEVVHVVTFKAFTDRVTKCRTNIRIVDGPANPTDEATIIHVIKKAAPGLFLVLSNLDSLSLEKLKK